jgi:hypothetical protein
MIGPAQDTDADAVAALFGRNHNLTHGRFGVRAELQTQTFVAREDDRLVGLVIVSHYADGVHSCGVIHVLEIDVPTANYAVRVSAALLEASEAWLAELGADEVLAVPTVIVRTARKLRPVGECILPGCESPQQYSGLPPAPVQVARQVWA